MESTNQKLNVLIVSATGQLGALITKHALANPKLQVNILVRDPTKNKELVEQVEKAGGKVFIADLTDPQSLKGVTKGIHTVISAVNSYDDKIAVDGQINLLKEAIASGVVRFSPSDYGVNYTHFTREELSRSAVISPKFKFQDYLDTTPIKQLHFYNGNFMETYFWVQSMGFGYWGDSDLKQDFTTYEDIAKVVVAAVANPDLTGTVTYVGEKLTIHDVAKIYNKVRGANVEPKNKGSVEELKKLYDEARKKGDANADFLGLFLVQADKRSTFEKTNNADFPQIKATSMEEFLKQRSDIKLP